MQGRVANPRSPAIGAVARGLAPITSLLLSIFLSAGPVAAAPWRGVIPARSGKKQVVARLGKPSFQSEDRMEFSHTQGKATIFFYTEEDTTSRNLSSQLIGKVLTIYFYPKKPATFDRVQLAKTVVSVGHGVTEEGEIMTSYDDGEHGISYHFKKDETRVWRIVYYAPRAEFAKFMLPQTDSSK
jgi:hypothetical protein